MCVLWFWAEGRRQCQQLGAAEEGRPCREPSDFCSSHTFHSQGAAGHWPWGSSFVDQGHPRMPEIGGKGVSGEAINEMDGRTGASMDGIDQQTWKDPLRLRSEGHWSHGMSSVSRAGHLPRDPSLQSWQGCQGCLSPGRALSLCQCSPLCYLPKGLLLPTAEVSVSQGMGIWDWGYWGWWGVGCRGAGSWAMLQRVQGGCRLSPV